MSQPTFLSLFSGIGGLDLGLERAGWTCVGQVEIEPFCQRVLAKHWPQVPRWGDIKELKPHELPRADLICAGFPCQPVSAAGKRLAQDDPRWLWPHVARFVRDLRPTWVLLENVPGLLARGMGDVLGDLAACGYDAEWDCIPASAVGAPHRRDRVWVVAYAGGEQHQGCRPANERPAAQELPTAGDRDGPFASRSLADSNGSSGRRATGLAVSRAGRETLPAGPPKLGRRHSHVANPDRASEDAQPSASRSWPPARQRGWWATEPDVGRVAHGVPARVDRLGSLGNAVVPQVAEHVGRLIFAAHRERAA